MVLNILLNPSAYRDLDMGLAPVITAILVLIFLVIFEIFTAKFIKKKRETLEKFNKIFKRFIFPILIVVLIIEKVTFGVASLLDKQEITLATKTIPLYQPLTFNSIARKYFGFEKRIKREKSVKLSQANGVNYPLSKIEIKNPQKVNIFIIAIDALRGDMITPETAPNIYSFAKDSLYFKENRSGGNATRFGIFTLFYSLNSPYWFSFVDAKREPIFFEVLKRLNYDIKILFSTSAKWPEFMQTTFFGVQDRVEDSLGADDKNSFKTWQKYIQSLPKDRAVFNFTFLNAPHGRYYPKKFAKFKPDGAGKINYIFLKKRDKNLLLNQYKNAIFYDDFLFGEMITELKDRNLYKDSIVILTSDHGEEFFEYGNFGHNTAFDKSQTNSPLIVKLPNQTPKVVTKLSSSIDLMPSILKYIGVTTPAKSYSNGFDNLFENSYKREFVTCGNWNYNAIISPKATYVFSNLPNQIMKSQKLDTKSYKPLKNLENIERKMQKNIVEVLNQNRKFLK
jgi:membrane-anchored protein YejM (alkaline phosphatase superfamily)